MNRRNAIMAAIVAGLAPTAALPKSREDEKRELLFELASLDLTHKEQDAFMLLVVAVSRGDRIGNQPQATLAELRSGMSVDDVYEQVTMRSNQAWAKA
jgi:hypothetical protein